MDNLDHRQIINYLLTRVRSTSSENNNEELTVAERRLRRRRLITGVSRFNTNYEESDDNLFQHENDNGNGNGNGNQIENQNDRERNREINSYNYFRTYPLNINWKDIYSYENDSYEILEEYGYIGVFFYNEIITHLPSNMFKIRPENFVYKILEFYLKSFNEINILEKEAEGFKYVKIIIDIIKSKVIIIGDLIESGLIMRKEFVILKVMLDIIIHYYSNYDLYNMNEFFVNELIPIAVMFYSMLTDEDIKFVNEKIKSLNIAKEILRDELNAVVSNNKKKYFKRLIILKNEIRNLFKGINPDKFIV